jgi:hypothetical protein
VTSFVDFEGHAVNRSLRAIADAEVFDVKTRRCTAVSPEEDTLEARLWRFRPGRRRGG